jgi:3-oxoacyl-[acyl-carrier protein] reductase
VATPLTRAAKAALSDHRSIAVDYARNGITANVVAPGWIATGSATEHEFHGRRDTDRTVDGPKGGRGACRLPVSVGASYISGQVFVVDRANSIAEEQAYSAVAGSGVVS